MRTVTTIAAVLLSSFSISVGAPSTASAGVFDPEKIMTVQLADGLVGGPVSIGNAPGDPTRLFVVEKIGFIRIYDLVNGAMLPTPFLDICASVSHPAEKGLLDVAFDPDWQTNGFFYIVYNRISDGATSIARYEISDADPNVADDVSEVVLKTIPQQGNGHQGGQAHFSTGDGDLYVSIGDDSPPSQSDPVNRAQDLSVLYGKMLRLDVDDPPDYIPDDNPYVLDPRAADEIWGYGLRNPWRFSFDRLTGDLYLADVGKSESEEVNFVPAASGGAINWGWRCMEGTLCTAFTAPCVCDEVGLMLPVYEALHSDSGTRAIIGGSVYRGSAIPNMAGRYFMANYCASPIDCNGWIRSMRVVPDGGGGHEAIDVIDHTDELNPQPSPKIIHITSFGEDDAGELYLVSRDGGVSFPDPANGQLWKIVNLGDVNADGPIDVNDLVAVITNWGPCPGCPADVNNDGVVDVNDLVIIVVNWTG